MSDVRESKLPLTALLTDWRNAAGECRAIEGKEYAKEREGNRMDAERAQQYASRAATYERCADALERALNGAEQPEDAAYGDEIGSVLRELHNLTLTDDVIGDFDFKPLFRRCASVIRTLANFAASESGQKMLLLRESREQADGRADRIFDLLNERGAFRGAPQIHRAITVQIIREALNEPEQPQPSPQGTVSGAQVRQHEPDALFASAQEPTNESRLLSRAIHLQIEAYFAARPDACRFLANVERVLISEPEPPLNPVISNYAVTSDRDASFRVSFNEPRRT